MSNNIWVITDLAYQEVVVLVGEQAVHVPLADVTPAVGALLSTLQQLDMEPEGARSQIEEQAGATNSLGEQT